MGKLTILGLDPGLEKIGFGVIEKDLNHWHAKTWGIIHTHKDKTLAQRLVELYHDANQLFDQMKPDIVCIEKLFYFRNQTTIMPVAQARGVLLLICGQRNVLYQEFTPMQVKLQVAGYGKADKQAVQHMVKEQLKLDCIPRPDDAADALALAMCYQDTL